MTRINEENDKKDRVEGVRRNLEIKDLLRARVALYSVGGICVALFIAGWTVRGAITAFQTAIEIHFNAIESKQDSIAKALGYKVSSGQLSSWATELGNRNRGIQNRDGTLGLIVPPVNTLSEPPAMAEVATH